MSRPSTRTRSRGRTARPPERGRSPWLIIVIVLAVVVVAVAAVSLTRRQSGDLSSKVQTFSNLARDHVSGTVKYPQVPPVGGQHNPVWLNCGIYDQPVPNENAVHSMEHGAAWITYQPDLPPADLEQLYSLVRGKSYVILSPYPGLPARVVASAWGVQLRADSVADPLLAQFIAKYANGPQTPEPGAACTGGIGVPLVK